MSDNRLENFKLPRWEELPNLDLYLEQVLSLIDDQLADYLSLDGKKIMTKTMVNNYVKLKFIQPPVNKKYDKTAVASLFIIAILKQVYSIGEISSLIRLAIKTSNKAQAYDRFCSEIEEAVKHAFMHTSMPKHPDHIDPRDIMWNVCNSFACQLYVRNTFLREMAEQIVIDSAESTEK